MFINDLILYIELIVLFFDYYNIILIKFIFIINLIKDFVSLIGNEIFCFLFLVEYKFYVLMWEIVKYNIYNC